MMAGGMGGHKGHGGVSHEIWDVERDQMREFANVRQEIKETAWQHDKENSKYFYDQRAAIDRTNYDTLLGFKNAEVLGLQNKGEILGRIDGLERRLDRDIIEKQSAEITFLKTIQGVRGLGMVPAVPYAQYPIHCNDPYSYAPAV